MDRKDGIQEKELSGWRGGEGEPVFIQNAGVAGAVRQRVRMIEKALRKRVEVLEILESEVQECTSTRSGYRGVTLPLPLET